MSAGVHRQGGTGFGLVALVLGAASLVPVYGIAAVPFALLLGALARHKAAVALALLGALENALVVLVLL